MGNTYEETKYILKKYNIHANKNLGQNFLINENIINKIVESANITKEDLIIEIGPGLGTLTAKLLEKAGKLIAIELDKKMLSILTNRFNLYNNFELINNDILKTDLKEIINRNLSSNNELKNVKIVANLPYYITTPIIMKLLEEKLEIDTITVMVQKEVAERLIAIPGTKNSGAITYSVYYYAEAKKVVDVPKNSFIPEPEVNSEVIQLTIRKNSIINVKDEKLLFKLIKQAFMQRRKTLINALGNLEIIKNKEQISGILQELGIDLKVRGEVLSIEQFAQIADKLKNI